MIIVYNSPSLKTRRIVTVKCIVQVKLHPKSDFRLKCDEPKCWTEKDNGRI